MSVYLKKNSLKFNQVCILGAVLLKDGFVDWQWSSNCYQSQKVSTKSDSVSLEMSIAEWHHCDNFIVFNKNISS